MDKQAYISFIKVSPRRHTNMNGAMNMTKELALTVLKLEGVYLTSEGKALLEVILNKKTSYKGN